MDGVNGTVLQSYNINLFRHLYLNTKNLDTHTHSLSYTYLIRSVPQKHSIVTFKSKQSDPVSISMI